MSDHTRALVPIEAWAFNSTDVAVTPRRIDIGLLAESLIYYESVYLNLGNQPQFAELLRWFTEQGAFGDFLALVRDGTICVYDYAFLSTAILDKAGNFQLWNVQDPIQAQPNTFTQRYLYHGDVAAVLPRSRDREKLYKAFKGLVTEVKAEQFGNAIENARRDQEDPARNALIVQSLVNEVWSLKQLGPAPRVEAVVKPGITPGQQAITWNVSFERLAQVLAPKPGFHPGQPLIAGAFCNRLIWSAAGLNCDLYLSRPMSLLVGDKLFESARRLSKTRDVITRLERDVEFPDVRGLVNAGKLSLSDVLRIRAKAKRFRDWLQSEAERDRDALFAYHSEVARESGFRQLGRRALRVFGVLGSAGVGGYLGAVLGDPVQGGVAATGVSAAAYLIDVASKIGTDWRPTVFGDWLGDRITELLDARGEATRE